MDTSTSARLFRDHVFGCFIEDRHGIASIDEIGEDNIMCETDYPHTRLDLAELHRGRQEADRPPSRGDAVQDPAGQRRAAVPVHAGGAAGLARA